VANATPRPLYPRERPGRHCIGGWVGPRAGLDGWSVEEAAEITDHREKNRPTARNVENEIR